MLVMSTVDNHASPFIVTKPTITAASNDIYQGAFQRIGGNPRQFAFPLEAADATAAADTRPPSLQGAGTKLLFIYAYCLSVLYADDFCTN